MHTSIKYLIKVLSFVRDLSFNVRGVHVLGGCGREKEDWVTTSRGVYVPLKALFLVDFAYS